MARMFGRGSSGRSSAQARTDGVSSTNAGGGSQVVQTSAPVEAVVLDDRYEIGAALGVGGEASVHIAHDRVLGREVAIKMFHTRSSPPSDSRLQRLEARVVAALNHYALTTLLDVGVARGLEDERRIYLVMEYVRGQSLRERLRRGPLEVSEACWLGFDLAEGLDYMHQAGFVHRDVKPANILISSVRSVRPVVAKLTDFGIATPVGVPDLSEFTVGTAAYLSPEQVEGLDARPESDIYSLGLVLLEAITGRPEFSGTIEQAAFARLDRDPRIPDGVPPRVGALLQQMTARRPEDRLPLFDAAVELQQILVDDLVRRRGIDNGLAAVERPPAADPVRPAASTSIGTDQFDEVLQLASFALRVPRVLLVLDDGTAAQAVAQRGWPTLDDVPVPPSSLVQPPASTSTVRVRDVLERQSLRDHEFFAGPAGVRAFAGAALPGTNGGSQGWLLAFDEQPRDFTADELTALAGFAGLVSKDIEFRAAVRRALFRD